MELFERVGVDMEVSDNSFSVSLDGFEWGTRSGLSSLFAQKKNIFNPWFWKMSREIIKFKKDASIYIEELDNNPDIDRNETLGHFVQSHGYSELFQKVFLIPICASIWPCSSAVMTFSAYLILSLLRNLDILELLALPSGHTPKWRSQSYVNRIEKELENRSCQVKTSSEIYSVLTNDEGCAILSRDGLQEAYDGCIIAAHAPDALKILGKQATYDELRVLDAFHYADRGIPSKIQSNLCANINQNDSLIDSHLRSGGRCNPNKVGTTPPSIVPSAKQESRPNRVGPTFSQIIKSEKQLYIDIPINN